MNYLKNKLVPTEIRNDIGTLKTKVSNLEQEVDKLSKFKFTVVSNEGQHVSGGIPDAPPAPPIELPRPAPKPAPKPSPKPALINEIENKPKLKPSTPNAKREVYKAPLLKDIEKGVSLKKAPKQEKQHHNVLGSVRTKNEIMNAIAERMQQRRKGISDIDDWEE